MTPYDPRDHGCSPEKPSEIKALQKEIERLRAALGKIANWNPADPIQFRQSYDLGHHELTTTLHEIAREALKGDGEGEK